MGGNLICPQSRLKSFVGGAGRRKRWDSTGGRGPGNRVGVSLVKEGNLVAEHV